MSEEQKKEEDNKDEEKKDEEKKEVRGFAKLNDDDWGRLITEKEYEKMLNEEIEMEEEKRELEAKGIEEA